MMTQNRENQTQDNFSAAYEFLVMNYDPDLQLIKSEFERDPDHFSLALA